MFLNEPPESKTSMFQIPFLLMTGIMKGEMFLYTGVTVSEHQGIWDPLKLDAQSVFFVCVRMRACEHTRMRFSGNVAHGFHQILKEI